MPSLSPRTLKSLPPLLDPIMAANSTPMALDGFLVETVDENRRDGQNALPGSVLDPVPVVMPEPQVEQPVGGFVMPEKSDVNAHGLPMATFSGGAQEQTGVVEQDVAPKESRNSQDGSKSSTKSGSSGKEENGDEDKAKHHHHHHHSKAGDHISKIPYEVKHDEVVSGDPSLNADGTSPPALHQSGFSKSFSI